MCLLVFYGKIERATFTLCGDDDVQHMRLRRSPTTCRREQESNSDAHVQYLNGRTDFEGLGQCKEQRWSGFGAEQSTNQCQASPEQIATGILVQLCYFQVWSCHRLQLGQER